MKRKLFLGIVILMLIVAIVVVIFALPKNNKIEDNTENNIQNDEKELRDDSNNEMVRNSKILVVYYSAQSHTKAVAEKIADNLGADIFSIIPKKVYTSNDLDWTDSNSRVSKEHNDISLRNVELELSKVENWNDYDTILIGYPIWWGEASWVVSSFVKDNDFTGKKVIPFCTSVSSGLGESGKLLEKETNTGNWLEGKRFSSEPSDNDIKKFTDSLK